MKWCWIFLCFMSGFFQAQKTGFVLSEDVKKEVIPFQLINNLVFIPVNLNGVQLTFLLDTGVSETLLLSLENKEVNFENIEKLTFSGLGENIDIQGLKSIRNKVKIGDHFRDDNHTVYIILNEDFNISSHVGIPVHGIMGYYFFKNLPIEIDYVTKKITVYNDQKLIDRRTKRGTEFPITLEYNKPYIIADVEMTSEKKASKLLIDSGNSDAVWLFPSLIKNFVYNRPNIEDFLGRGFNGDIFGRRSRIHNFYLSDFKFEKPIAAMPDEYSIQNVNLAKDRKGSMGGEILRRFTVFFDYPNLKVYLRKNRNYNDPFLFNLSGIDFKHDGVIWENEYVKVENPLTKQQNGNEIISNTFQYKLVMKPVFSIAGVRKGSPGDKAGLRKDDVLVYLDGRPTSTFSLQELGSVMLHGEGKRHVLEVKRKGETLRFSFVLEDPIPYQENETP